MSSDNEFYYEDYPSLIKMAQTFSSGSESTEFLVQDYISQTASHTLKDILLRIAARESITYEDARIYGHFAVYIDDLTDIVEMEQLCDSEIIVTSDDNGVSFSEFEGWVMKARRLEEE